MKQADDFLAGLIERLDRDWHTIPDTVYRCRPCCDTGFLVRQDYYGRWYSRRCEECFNRWRMEKPKKPDTPFEETDNLVRKVEIPF